MKAAAAAAALLIIGGLLGCEGVQSALDPAGPSAREIATLWWWMAAGAAAIFLLVLLALLRGLRGAALRPLRRPMRLVVLGGLVLAIVTLSALVPFNVFVASGVSAPRSADTVTIRVSARQWWWELEYDDGRPGSTFSTANEIYLPVGRPVELLLESHDVIHSFWLPALAGKLDVIPGRTNRMMIEADEVGIYRGQCAEFCGRAHAQMSLIAVAVTPDEFAEWLRRQSSDAIRSTDADVRAGAELFAAAGCPLCHMVRGHGAWGQSGPDLTHVGTRLTIGAAVLPNTPEHVALWISDNDAVKPGNRMPEFRHLDADARQALATYLASLQ
jgi:cytochrome c oxidase subunit 2